jgi:hypothetical protein
MNESPFNVLGNRIVKSTITEKWRMKSGVNTMPYNENGN